MSGETLRESCDIVGQPVQDSSHSTESHSSCCNWEGQSQLYVYRSIVFWLLWPHKPNYSHLFVKLLHDCTFFNAVRSMDIEDSPLKHVQSLTLQPILISICCCVTKDGQLAYGNCEMQSSRP